MYPGKKQDSFKKKKAIYGFTVKVIAILRKRKSKNFRRFNKIRTAKSSIYPRKEVRKPSKNPFWSLKTPIFIKATTCQWVLKGYKFYNKKSVILHTD